MVDKNLEIIKAIQKTGKAYASNVPTTKITTEKSTMFERKKRKTGCETPEFRKPSAPPPPPTSGSNAVKPNPNYIPPASVAKSHPIVCAMKLEELDDWVKTRAQIGDVAYCHDRILDHHYIYRYLKPDDNPVWIMMNPDFLEKYSKKENEGDNKMNITGICPYETPCGYCTKWDKKCDKKIGGYTTILEPVRKKAESNEGLSCYKCRHYDSISSVCSDCHPIFKNFEAKEN